MSITGLRFAPDLDAVAQSLAPHDTSANPHSGSAGRTGRSHVVLDTLRREGLVPAGPWPILDDAAFAHAIARVYRMGRGMSTPECATAQSEHTDATVLPLTDQPVELHVLEDDASGARTSRHAWRWINDPDRGRPHGFVVAGLEHATPAPGVLDAIRTADAVVLPPMLPVVDAAGFLAVDGVRDALRGTSARVVALSPIDLEAGHPEGVQRAAWELMATDPSSSSMARLYADFLDHLVIDDDEAPARYPSTLTVTRAPLAAALRGDAEACDALRAVVLG